MLTLRLISPHLASPRLISHHLTSSSRTARAGRRVHAAVGLARAVVGALPKVGVGLLDLLAKVSEGVKNQASLRSHTTTRRRAPLAIYVDRLVRQYNDAESRAYELIALCKPDALQAPPTHHPPNQLPPLPPLPHRPRTVLHPPSSN